jgi:dethiobiotin synthetase
MSSALDTSRLTPRGLFVTGTDTGVGKSLVACALLHAYAARGLRVVGMKPVAAGAMRINGILVNDDVEQLIAASNVAAPRELVNPYCYASPIAPHIAAADEKNTITIKYLNDTYQRLSALADVTIVEGAGGFCVPLNDAESSADLARALALPVVMVVGMRLGCLNHALLAAEAIRARGLTLAGWVANHIDADMSRADENVAALQARLGTPMLARIAYDAHVDAAQIASRIVIDALP